MFSFLGLLVGLFIGVWAFYLYANSQKKQWGMRADDIINAAEKEANDIRRKADHDGAKIMDEARRQAKEDRDRASEIEKKAIEIESRLEQKETKLDQKLDELVKKTEELNTAKEALAQEEEALSKKKADIAKKLSEVAKLSAEDARTKLFEQIEEQYEADFIKHIEKKKAELRIREEDVCREILVNSMQQYAGAVTAETTQTTIELESDDLKGRIIGKEGRNITTFEKETGVSIIIDDTPNTIFISSFDLFRRYVAKKSLEDLLSDKRIQPARIEEIVQNNQKDAEKLLLKLGQQVLSEMNITGFPDEVVSLIGKLRFRTSYGQNILKHSQEVAYIAESIAKQVGADPQIALQWGILHDIGKALDHDIEGTHPEIGGKILRKYGFDDRLINLTEAHHGAVPITCVETGIIMIADAISAVRPGARRANVEEYIKRMKDMESLVLGFSGVEKAYALSAGREVRVFVDAKKISDLEAEKLAREIAVGIQDNLQYPGEVKVMVSRENRYVEYAR
jgi:ribonucrease Y